MPCTAVSGYTAHAFEKVGGDSASRTSAPAPPLPLLPSGPGGVCSL